MNRQSRQSLYTTLSIIIVSTVALIMSIHVTYTYIETKAKTVAELKHRSNITIVSLQKNVTRDIEAYAVQEYETLILNAMEYKDIFAIVVKDYNMGKILDQPAYVSGKIRDANWSIVDYDPGNRIQSKQLETCYHFEQLDIVAPSGEKLGTVGVCTSNRWINKELNAMLVQNFFSTIAISLLLVVTLFIAIRRFLLQPLSKIVTAIGNSDSDGTPREPVPVLGSKEILALSGTINRMIEALQHSRTTIRQQQESLNYEKDRFKLAIEGSQDGLWDWNLDNDEVFFSSRWKEMLGYRDDEITNHLWEWSSRVHPDDFDNAMQAVNDHLEGKTSLYQGRFRMCCKDGSWRWVLDRGKALFNARGKAVRIVGFQTDITEQVQHQEALDHSAKHDALTHLPNRFLFNELIQKAIHHCRRNRKLLALLYVDLDGFKEINDTYGHEAGDIVLITVAQRIQNTLRQEDISARLGGDEFVIAVSDLTQSNEIIQLLQRLLHGLQQSIFYNNDRHHELHISASIGVTIYPQQEEVGPDALLRQADQAMYAAKSSGKNHYRFFNLAADTLFKERKQNLKAFRHALEHDECVLYYQPKVDMSDNKVLGFEALLRWQHPQKGLLGPDSFLPLLNHEKELMLALGRWVFETAFQQLSDWIDAGYDLGININVSAHEFKESATYTLLESLLERYTNIAPRQVELEILETSALEDTRQVEQMIMSCQQLGLKVAIDDFGTGYSTLSYLKNLPVDTLKIDRSFVMDMLHDNASFSILEAAMGLAQAFRCSVVAEGVESVEHGVLLLYLGCNIAQGYGIAKPMPAETVPSWIENYRGYQAWRETTRIHHKSRPLLYAIIEHRHWLLMLEKHLDDPAHNGTPELDAAGCQFGAWLRSEDVDAYKNDPTLGETTAMHTSLHELAAEIVQENPGPDRERKRSELRTLHAEILEVLNRMIQNV